LQFALEEFRVGPEFLDQLFAFGRSQQRKRRLACSHRRRRVRGRKQKWPSEQIEKIDKVARAAYVAAHRANRLAQGSHLNVNASMAMEMVDRATAIYAKIDRNVSLVHQTVALDFFRL